MERDGYRCRACGRDKWVAIHHRRLGDNHPSLLITLCAASHAQVHRLLSIWKWIPALLAELWVEQHPGSPVQRQFDEPQRSLQLNGRKEPLTRPAPADDDAGCGTPSPQGRGRSPMMDFSLLPRGEGGESSEPDEGLLPTKPRNSGIQAKLVPEGERLE